MLRKLKKYGEVEFDRGEERTLLFVRVTETGWIKFRDGYEKNNKSFTDSFPDTTLFKFADKMINKDNLIDFIGKDKWNIYDLEEISVLVTNKWLEEGDMCDNKNDTHEKKLLKKMYEELLEKYIVEKGEWDSRSKDLLLDRQALEEQLLKTEETLFTVESELESTKEELEELREIVKEQRDDLVHERMRRF